MSINKVIFIGNVGKDPDIRYFDSSICVASFSLATTERGYTLQNGTQVPERTDWHTIVCKGDQAKFVEKWVKKGASLYIEGKIRYRQYEDQEKVKRSVTEIFADRVEFFSFGKREEKKDISLVEPASQESVPDSSDDLPF